MTTSVCLLAAACLTWLLAPAACDDSFPSSVNLKNGDSFEYIVVGAGAAGSVLAARLALAGKNVLLVEAGGDPGPFTTIPRAAQALLGSKIDYNYETISNNMSCLSYRKQQCGFSRGKCLGGSTSMNDMMYTRGHPHDWDELDTPGWYWKDMKPYFLRSEGLQDLDKLPPTSAPYHNTTGEMKLQFFADPQNPWHSRIIEGLKALNFPQNPDINAASQIGVSQVLGYIYDNKRISTATAFLSNDDVKNKLKVAKNTQCTGVIMEDNVAKGINVVVGRPIKKKLKLYADVEVILSAGAVVTPQILMLSGIGHADHLNAFNIPVRSNLPVGDNMTDHLFPLMFVKLDNGTGLAADLVEVSKAAAALGQLFFHNKGPFTTDGLTDVTTFINSECYDYENRTLRNNSAKCELPTIQNIFAYVARGLVSVGRPMFRKGTGLKDTVTKQIADLNQEYAFIVVSPQVLQPYSQGNVRLASADPLARPAIYPNFLADERDLEEMLKAITIVEHLMETPPFKTQNATIVHLNLPGCPEYESDSEGYWRCYCRHMTHSTFHAVGTAALGPVVDARMRVHGVRRLRACDLAVLPRLPRANTAAAALALAEKLADLILRGE